MRLIISPDYEQCSQWAADYVAYKIKAARPTENKPFVMPIPAKADFRFKTSSFSTWTNMSV